MSVINALVSNQRFEAVVEEVACASMEQSACVGQYVVQRTRQLGVCDCHMLGPIFAQELVEFVQVERVEIIEVGKLLGKPVELNADAGDLV